VSHLAKTDLTASIRGSSLLAGIGPVERDFTIDLQDDATAQLCDPDSMRLA